MKKTIALFAVVLSGLLTSCCISEDTLSAIHRQKNGPRIEHVVLVWLKKPGDAAMKDKMTATARTFPKEIPGILSMSIGDAVPSDRDVVDDSFDLALVIRFKDKAALDAYEKHPVHVKAVKAVLAPNVSKLKVYDVAVR